MKLSANNIVLKVLGLLLLAAAGLKGWQLLTEPVANVDIWSNRYFLTFTVEFEIALGIWLLSGLFKKAAWLVGLLCFAAFSCITLYKGITGADSCGCFGAVKVNPWITLFAVDLPAVLLLAIFRPKLVKQQLFNIPHWLEPLPKFSVLAVVSLIGLTTIAVSSPVLILNEPAMVTTKYEVLEPSEWIGKELPILEHIDIAQQLKTGNWLVVLYHHDCPSCAEAIPKIERVAREFEGNENFLQFALIEVPPYGKAIAGQVSKDSGCIIGKLDISKEWFMTTPAMVLVHKRIVRQSYEDKVPSFETILNNIVTAEYSEDLRIKKYCKLSRCTLQ